MTNAAEVLLVVKGKDEVSGLFSKVKRDAQSLGSSMGSALKTGGLLAAGGIGAAGFALVSFTKAAAEEQAGIARLQQSVTNVGGTWQQYGKQIEDAVRAGEKLAFSDDTIRDSLSALTTATGSVEEAMKRQKIAMDLARGTGLDLATASKLVGKVSEENTQVLKRYGITLRDGATEQEALAEIQKRFSGQSEAYAKNATAKWQIFNNQMDNIKESIGSALLPTVTMLGAALGDFLTRHQADIDKFSEALAKKIPEGIAAIANAFEQVRPTLQYVFDQMREGFKVIQPGLEWILNNKVALVAAITAIGAALLLAFTPVTLPILGVIAAIGALLFILGTSREEWQRYGEVVNKLWEDIQVAIEERLGIIGTVLVAYMDLIRNQVETTFKVIRDIVVIVMALIQGDWGAAWEGVKQLARDILDGIVTEYRIKLGLMRDITAFAFESIKGVASAALAGLRDVVVYAGEGIISWFRDLPDRIKSAIGDVTKLLYYVGIDIVRGLWNGVSELWDQFVNWVVEKYNLLPKIVRDILEMFSPSRVMMRVGNDFMMGMQVGMEQGAAGMFASLATIAQRVKAAAAEVRQAVVSAVPSGSDADWANSGSMGAARDGGAVSRNPARVGGRTRDEWTWSFGASGIPASEYNRKLKEMFGYSLGTMMVPSDGWRWLHRGEAVQTRGDQSRSGGALAPALANYGTVQIVLPNVRNPQDFARELDRYMR